MTLECNISSIENKKQDILFGNMQFWIIKGILKTPDEYHFIIFAISFYLITQEITRTRSIAQ